MRGDSITIFLIFLTFFLAENLYCSEGIITTPPPVISSPLYPCSNCHRDIKTDPEKRTLEFHSEIDLKRHTRDVVWCLNCHDKKDRDYLVLINGERIGFTASYRLCGQCHGSIYKDWRAGVHGKRTGSWRGDKRYFICTACHDPHAPRFKKLKPERTPLRPEMTLRRNR